MVTMNGWNKERIHEMLDAYRVSADPDDPKERKRLVIAQAAAELFAAQGYRRTNVDQVAARAGVAKGTVYLYFKKKSEMLLHAVVEEKRRYVGRVVHLFEPQVPALERLTSWLEAAFSLGVEMPLVSRILRGDRELLTVLYEAGADMGQDFKVMQIDFVAELIEEAVGSVGFTRSELRDRAQMLIGLIFFSGSIPDPKVRGELSVRRYGELLTRTIVDGLVLARRDRKSVV